MASKTRKALVATLALTAIAATPARASLDEGGVATSPSTAPRVEVTGLDWSDAAVGIGIGLSVGALTFGGGLAKHRQRAGSPDSPHAAVR